MQNFFVRKHLLSELSSPSFSIGDIDDESISHLHLNINSFSRGAHRCYSNEQDVEEIKLEYLRILPFISNLDPEKRFVGEDQLLFTHGSAEAIDLLIRAYCEPGQDAIITTTPSFPYYGQRARLENVRTYEIPLQGPFYTQLDLDAILSTPSKLLFLCNPSNPVGTFLCREQIEKLLQVYPGLVVIDEAYLEWSHEPSLISLLSVYPKLVVLRTFSKIWGLAGVRCGVAIAHDWVLRPLRVLQAMLNFPTTSQSILREAIRNYLHLPEYKARAEQCRNDLISWLNPLPFVQKIYPSHTNFLLVQCVRAGELCEYLYQNKVFVKDLSKTISNAVRISLGLPHEMARLKTTLLNFYKGDSL